MLTMVSVSRVNGEARMVAAAGIEPARAKPEAF